MKKYLSYPMMLVLLLLCGCTKQENTDTRFLLDTFVTLTADCTDDVLDGAFSLCDEFEKKLSRTLPDSEVSRLNGADGFIKISDDTKKIIERSVYYGDLSGGKFDITICSVSSLWDFNGEVIPSRDEIAEALKNVDYNEIEIDGNLVSLNKAKIDLGGIAKGYIADRLLDYFKEKNVKSGIINLGGNVLVFGDRGKNVGIKKPFGDGEIACTVKVKNTSVVTSGTYERYIEKDGKKYHHILDPETGYSAETDLASATVICDSSFDADALATVCVLKGLKEAKALIENTDNAQAVFIDNGGIISYTSGLVRDGNSFTLR